MDLKKMKAVFAALPQCTAWSLQLLKINNSTRNGTSYLGREITLSPSGSLASFVVEITNRYIDESKGILDTYHDIYEYDGSTVDNVVYFIPKTHELISDPYNALMTAIAAPDTEINPLELKVKAYMLRGIVNIDGEEKPIKLFSMQNPVTLLEHKFLHADGTFKKIADKVISLRTSIDVIIMDDTVFMLTLAGEKLFNMVRSYKAVCARKLKDIEKSNIVNDFDVFSTVAKRGHNPRKFVAFNDAHLQKLNDSNCRKRMANTFNIPMNGNLFDTTKPDVADKIVKLLCDRGMIEPFDENPMEVVGSRKWE